MKKVALITGATSGLGLEFAKIHASQGGSLVLVARNMSKLEEIKVNLQDLYNVSVLIISIDLSNINSAFEIFAQINKENIQIDYLINNAGFGDFGMFHETDLEKECRMINLNIITLTILTKLFLSNILRRDASGKILNIASTASFQPAPTMAVYGATKAYVLSFSEAISNELLNKNISVTTLCPGPTETGFQVASALEGSKLFSNKKLPTANEVATFGYNAMVNGKSVVIHGWLNYIMSNSIRFATRSSVLKISRRILGKV